MGFCIRLSQSSEAPPSRSVYAHPSDQDGLWGPAMCNHRASTPQFPVLAMVLMTEDQTNQHTDISKSICWHLSR